MKMLQKWKIILANWINCYSEEDTNKRNSVTTKSLVNIISHLRENFNLDESTSSTLDAQTIQEFILEKYPAFRFENGNLEPKNEEEIYLAASLLLYFVCVNSKDLDIKKVMCHELSSADQEIILKFSKSLMDCTDISSTDVLTAIAEACGQDAATATIGPTLVAETPPALRSLHGEVRRLQAALDAERFDRNYLQEELSRTNLKMEKLLKDKEQYEQDIVNLKAKLSTCGQDTGVQHAEESNNNSVKLIKQLEQTENRLVTVQEALDEVQYERDMYRSKLDELKRERDKWIATSHEETSRACRLEDELETERKHVQSLRELVTELRQHNRLNGVDTSQLECDDLDASVRSLHNTSVCSEACANVIEVQLSEERAKIVVLEQQIKLLQDQLDDVTRKSEEETQNFTRIISGKDTDILNLKHRINEEIEEKNNLKLRYEDDVTRLNNEVNELEQRIRGNSENSRRIIDSKMKEIQILQEEKLSLLQSMSDESAKLGNIIQKLTSDFDAEKTSKLKMKEEYENKVMKLKEKVLNRNNELVELQNKISENGEAIEKLQFDLRKEKESRGELINKYNSDVTNLNMQIQAYEDSLRQRNDDIANLKEQLHEFNASIGQLQKERENLHSCFAKCKDEISILEDCKAQLLINLHNRDSQIESLQKDKERVENEYTEEKEKLQYNLDEINATVETLKNQLQNEIQYKIGIQNELQKSELSNQNLTETINNLNEQISTFKIDCQEKEHDLLVEREVVAGLKKTCKELDIQVQQLHKDKSEQEIMIQELKETINNLNEQLTGTKQRLVREEEVCAELKKTCEDLNIKIEEMNKIITEKETQIKDIKKSLEEAKMKFDEKCVEKDKVIDILNNKLTSKVINLNDLEEKYSVLHKEKEDLGKDLKDMSNLNIDLQNEISGLSQKVKEHEITIDKLKQDIDEKTKENDIIQQKYDSETVTLMNKLNVTEKSLKELQTQSDNLIEAKESQIETLKMEIEKLQISLQEESEKSFSTEKEKSALLQHINEANMLKNNYEKEFLNKCTLLNTVRAQLNEEILGRDALICDLKNKLDHSEKSNADITEEMKTLNSNLHQTIQSSKDITLKKDEEIGKLMERIKHLETLVLQSEKELKAVIDNNKQVVEGLQRDNVQLHYTIEEDNSTHELLIKEKDAMIEGLETRLKNVENTLNLIQKEYEADKFVWEKLKTEMQEEINGKIIAITHLTNKVTAAGVKMRNLEALNNVFSKEKDELTAAINSLRNTCTESAHTCDNLKERLSEQTALINALENAKQTLITEKENLLQKIASQESDYKKNSLEMDSLLNEKAILVQELMEEKSVRKIADQAINKLKQDINEKTKENDIIQQKYDSETVILMTKLNVTEKSLKELQTQSDNLIKAKESQIETLTMDIEKLQISLQEEREKSFSTEKEKSALLQHMNEANMLKNNYEKEFLNKCTLLNSVSAQLNEEILRRDALICELKNKLDHSEKSNADYADMTEEIKSLKNNLNQAIQSSKDITLKKDEEKGKLMEKIKHLETLVLQSEKELKAVIDNNKQVVEVLQRDNVQLHYTIEENNSTHELLIKEKDAMIEGLETHLKNVTNTLNLIQKEYEADKFVWEKLKTEMQEEINEKNIAITHLTNKVTAAGLKVRNLEALNNVLNKEKDELTTEVNSLRNTCTESAHTCDNLKERLTEQTALIHALENAKQTLITEKENLLQEIASQESAYKKISLDMDSLLNEKAILVQELMEEKSVRKIADQVAVASLESPNSQQPRQLEHRDLQQQVDTTSTDYSSMESSKTITDLEKIIQDRNRTITTLQTDITYLKSLVAESENKYLDAAKELEMSKENCHQLSSQLKKIVHQKNEEIADLKKQVTKMSVTENRASQIIKVSAKYQAIILKRIAEIKSNTVLKELTNFGNTNCDTDLRKSLTAGTITMEDLENFLETTERHIRRCSEKQIALQKERDRLAEINRINESEIINIRKFLTELSVSIKTFNSVKELYTQKLSRVVSLQRTVRREILSLDGRITDAAMGSLERGYSAVMQDLYECAMNLERWIERCVARTISSEKIKQAFSPEDERASLSSASFQNTGLEIQLEELQNSFQKLLEEVARAQKGEGAKDVQSVTIMEVRAEYEDKLNRMKAKMKQLYQEQITIFKEKQHEEIIRLESELKKTRSKLQECEEHIKSLTTELWTVGEKYLMKKDEADWLRKKQRSGSLMSLQHVHSSGLVPPAEERGRPSDTHSLRSLPANNNNNNNKEGRGLHMSDEEGEVFDNRWLRELATTPRRDSEAPPGHRISELRYRNSLCPPHLKSSYPAETQFAPAIHEEDIKCSGSMSLGGKQRKEVGITAYKKPGPPTPSKQAGRLSATDSELRESLRIEADPSASRKTGTPSRLRSLFRSTKNDLAEGTPRSRRLSNIFRKK